MYKLKSFAFTIVTLFILSAFTACLDTSPPEVVFDTMKFSNITPEQLIDVMGKPESIDKWTYKGPKGNFPAKSYLYEDSKFEFLVIGNAVVRLTYIADINYRSESDILPMFSITDTSIMNKVADTGVALRYSSSSEHISDFWVYNMDDSANLIKGLKVTYNPKYF